MKITRAFYPGLFAINIFILFLTINEFSHEIAKQLILPFLVLIVILFILMGILARKDKDFFNAISDERSKKVDRSAGYYSWWFTIFFTAYFGIIADSQKLTIFQFVFVILTEMIFTIDIFHMYFNFKGKI